MKPHEIFNSMQNTSVCEVLGRLNVLGSKKMHLKNTVYEKYMENVKFLNVLKGLKQGLKVQDKEEYLAFTAK